jgi:outer membrane protein OmpA-like peptidoglycan-associated protein
MYRALLGLLIAAGTLAVGFLAWALSTLDVPARLQEFVSPPSQEVARPASRRQSGSSPAKSLASGREASALGIKNADLGTTGSRVGKPAKALSIDVARLEAGGVSVLAGSAPPESRVHVIVNGRTLAKVISSSDGQWSVVLTEGIEAGPLAVTLIAEAAGGGETLRSDVARLVVPGPKVAASSTATAAVSNANEGTASAVAANKAGAGSYATTAASPAGVRSPAAARELPKIAELVARMRRQPLAKPQGLGAASVASKDIVAREAPVPVPITFETDTDRMTADGEHAARLLVEYLNIRNAKSVTLTGHADARGADDYNIDLSRRRLDTIERYLRKGGYGGKLALLPKGKSEPYAGIDRQAASQEDIWQADRRVELRLAN